MSWKRISAVFLRYYYIFAKVETLSDLIFWPALEIILWGVTSVWIQHHENEIPNIALVILTGLVFWQIVWRSYYEVAVNLLQEFWNRNLINLFSTPLKLSEWSIAIMLTGLFKITITISFGAIVVWILYALNIFSLGWAFLPFCASLVLSGWFIGFLSASILIYFGQRMETLAWLTPYLFSPFCAVFYPVAALPAWGHAISYALPMTYIFEGMRSVVQQGTFPMRMFLMSIGLNVLYLFLTALLLIFLFNKSREKGLGRLE
ncbi:MAG TPA: ABC transporter permease [Rhabdochlamydiaceae bacterium]|jgi:ABC-2 type transport system permease protein